MKKPVTLEDVRRNPKLLKRFIEEHQSEADAERFEKTLGAIVDAAKKPRSGD